MTTQKLANFYENNELIDLYEIGNDYDEDDTNLGFNLPKRFTDFNNSFTNAEEFLALNDSLVERFPQFKTPLHDFLKTNNSERLGLAVNELLDPTKIDGDIYRQVSDDLTNNLSGFYQLPEEEQTKVRNVLASRNGLDGDSRWKTADEEDQNILTRPQPQISDDVLQYIGVANYVKTGDVSRKPRTRIRQDEIFKKLTGYSFEDITENRISKDIIESSQFQKGLTEFYNKNKDSIKIPDRSDTSTLTKQLQSFGYEVTGSIALGAVTSPMLAAGPPGIALFGITNFLGNYFINEEAQNIRKGQLAGVGEEGKTSFGEKFAAGITGMIPFGPGATGLRGIRNAALQGAATTGVETTIRTGIEEQRPPSLEETLTALSVGTIFGGTFKGSLDLFSKYVNKFQGLSGPEIDAQLTAKDKKNITKIVKDLEKIKKTQTEKIEQSVKRIDNLVDGKKPIDLPDTRGQGKFYHGTSQEITLQEGGEAVSSQNIYGNGFYTTDDLITGSKYQKKGKKQFLKPEIPIAKGVKRIGDLPFGIQSDLAKLDITDAELNQLVRPGIEVPSADRLRDLARQARQFPIDNQFSGGSRTNVDAFNKIADRLDELADNPPKTPDFRPVTYEIAEKQPVNFYDLDQSVDAELKTFINNFNDDPFENIVSEAVNDLGDNYTLSQLFDEIRGYANGRGVSSNTVIDEIFGSFQDYFKGKGFGGFTHQGGKKAGKGKRLHQVRIYFDPANQIDINKVNLNEFTRDTKKIPQINPEQVGDGDFTNARVESLINEGKISSSIKSRTETFEEAVELKNSPGFRKYISQLAKYRKENPSDRDILAAALEITDINTGIQDVNQKLINALNVKNDVNAVEQLGEDLIKSFGNLNDFLADAIPIRTDQARGLSIMGMSTEGLGSVTPEKWKAMTEPQKREFLRLQSGDIGINVDVANKDLETLSTSIRDAIKIYKDTGDPKTLNKLVNSIKRTNGNYNKVNKLVKYGILANIANYDILDRPLRVINEVWLSAILYGPDTHVVNSLSSALELVAGNIELYLDPVNLTNPRELEVAIKHTWNLFTGFDFALKGAKESFNLESNYFTGMSKLDDFKDRIAFSMDGDNAISEAVNYFGKHVIRLPYKALTSEDAFFQGLSINASAYSGATLQGIRKGLKGQALKDYVNEQAELVIETFAKRIGKIINSKDPNTKEDAIQLYEMVKDFAKRSTFSEDLTSGGQLSTVTKWLAEGSAKSPIVRRFIPFVRILKNLIGRQTQRTLFLGQTPYLSGFYNDYVNGSPLLQKQLRGRVIFSAAIGSFIWSQMEKYADPNNDVHITGGGPSNREAFGRKWRTGWRPYSLGYVQKNEDGSTKIGKDGNPVVKYYSFTRLDPISGLLMAYTDAYEVADLVGEGKVDEALTHTAVSGARNITDRLFFEGINNLAKLIYEPQRAQRWLAQTVSSNVIASGLLRKAKNIPSDLYDMGLLNWTGVTEDQAYQWKLQEDINVYKGDEGLAIANRVNRGLTKVVPEWNRVTKLPPIREHITNKPKIKTQKPGFDFLTWFISSETDNHPVKTVFAKMGKGVSEPSDTITSFGGSVEGQSGMPIDAVELDVYKMSDLRYLINTIDSNGRLENERGYNGMTIDKAMQTYMQTDWFKSNYEIIKNEKKPWNTHPEVIEAILNGPPNGKFPGFREINSSYIARGKDRFLTLPENVDKLEEATKLKMQSRMKYVEMLQKANERIEY